MTTPTPTGTDHYLDRLPTASVIICAYTEDRWAMLNESIHSVLRQTRQALELIVCIDHNPQLMERCLEIRPAWAHAARDIPITIVENRFEGRLGGARNTAAEIARGDVLVFLDDDASAEPSWLEHLLAPYSNTDVLAVGGAPQPLFETSRPFWFPPQFNWVFGCYYDGLPTSLAPVPRMIGAAMSVRRGALIAVGGFHSDNHDDMDLCLRLTNNTPIQSIMFEPKAVVRHNVSMDRVRWAYFWRRCFFVNRGKVKAFRDLGPAASTRADREFVFGAMRRSALAGLHDLRHGDLTGVARFAVLVTGVLLSIAGHAAGRFDELTRSDRG